MSTGQWNRHRVDLDLPVPDLEVLPPSSSRPQKRFGSSRCSFMTLLFLVFMVFTSLLLTGRGGTFLELE